MRQPNYQIILNSSDKGNNFLSKLQRNQELLDDENRAEMSLTHCHQGKLSCVSSIWSYSA